MIQRKKIIEELLCNMHAMRHKLMVGYTDQRDVVITPSQGFVLRFVEKNSTASVKAIADALHITSSAATQLIDGLVDKGYVIRQTDPEDRRGVELSLSEKAKKLFNEFKEQGLEKMAALFEVLTDEELARYAALNKKITESL